MKWYVRFVVVAGLFFYSTPLRAALGKGDYKIANGEDYIAQLESDRHEYYLAEPISLRFSLFNATNTTLIGRLFTACEFDAPECGLAIWYTTPSGKTVRWPNRSGDPALLRRLIDHPMMPVGPSESVPGETLLIYDSGRREFVLSEAGTYDFWAVHGIDNDPSTPSVSSPHLRIHVTAPKAAHMDAFAVYSDAHVALMLQRQKVDERVMAVAVSLAKEYPDSPYAAAIVPYVRDLLGTVRTPSERHREALRILKESSIRTRR